MKICEYPVRARKWLTLGFVQKSWIKIRFIGKSRQAYSDSETNPNAPTQIIRN